MNKLFHDPLAPKTKVDGLYPFEFKAPTYDNRSSRGISAGNYYGIAVKTPTGQERPRGLTQGPIPQTSYCFHPSEIFGKEDMKG